LIQAFSRTNRVLNGTKPYGNMFEQRLQRQQGPTISLGPPGHREATAAELPRPTAKSATDLPLGFNFSRHIPQHAPSNSLPSTPPTRPPLPLALWPGRPTAQGASRRRAADNAPVDNAPCN
jgi:hypothetical protein